MRRIFNSIHVYRHIKLQIQKHNGENNENMAVMGDAILINCWLKCIDLGLATSRFPTISIPTQYKLASITALSKAWILALMTSQGPNHPWKWHCPMSVKYWVNMIDFAIMLFNLNFVYVIWSSWTSHLSALLIVRYSLSKKTASFVSYCFSKPTFTHISRTNCPIFMGFSANVALCDVV